MSRSLFNSNAFVVTRSRAFVLTLLFALIQFSSLLHAAEHPFHIEEASCDVFLAVENGKSTLVDQVAIVAVGYAIDRVLVEVQRQLESSVVSAYRSRAPPLFSFS